MLKYFYMQYVRHFGHGRMAFDLRLKNFLKKNDNG